MTSLLDQKDPLTPHVRRGDIHFGCLFNHVCIPFTRLHCTVVLLFTHITEIDTFILLVLSLRCLVYWTISISQHAEDEST